MQEMKVSLYESGDTIVLKPHSGCSLPDWDPIDDVMFVPLRAKGLETSYEISLRFVSPYDRRRIECVWKMHDSWPDVFRRNVLAELEKELREMWENETTTLIFEYQVN